MSDPIPKEQDHATGESGDLGVWDGEPEMAPVPTWEGRKAIYSYPTHSMLGEHFEVGDEMVVMFRDCAVVTEITDVITDEDSD